MAQQQRIAIYARFSSDKQSDASIDDQVHRCREHLAQHGLDGPGVEVFSDYATSGASLQRTGFEAMMRAVESGQISRIVTEDMSRISRDFADSAAIFRQLEFAQVALIGIADGIDSTQPHGFMSFGIKSVMNQMYLSDLADKTRRGLEGRFRKELATGAVAYGYRTKKRSEEGTGSDVIVEAEEAELVRRIFRIYLDGVSYAGIAKMLNHEGIPTPRARTKHDPKHKPRGWVPTTIRAMLKNESYIGRWHYKTKQWVKRPGTNKRVSRSHPESEVMTHDLPHLVIVPAELWNGVAAPSLRTMQRPVARSEGHRGRATF